MDSFIVQFVEQGLWLVVLVSAPPVLAAAAAGLLTSLVQATTQVQDASVSYVPKAVAVAVALLIAGPWIGEQVMSFATSLFVLLPAVAR